MEDKTQICINEEDLQEILVQARRIVAPEAKYSPNNETYLKGVISQQADRAGVINRIVTSILFPVESL